MIRIYKEFGLINLIYFTYMYCSSDYYRRCYKYMDQSGFLWEFIHSSLQHVHEFGLNADGAGSFGVGEWDK